MNDFERKLARQEFRAIPGEWRAQILQAGAPPQDEPRFSWREWLWPGPNAWAAVAALWCIAGGLSLWSSDPAAPAAPAADVSASAPTSLYALNRDELRRLFN